VPDSANFTTPEADDEDLGEDLGGLDDLLASSVHGSTDAADEGAWSAKAHDQILPLELSPFRILCKILCCSVKREEVGCGTWLLSGKFSI